MAVASLRVWDETPQITRNFVLETKLTDFNNMAGKKSVLGIILSLTKNTDSGGWVGVIEYRRSVKHNYIILSPLGGHVDGDAGDYMFFRNFVKKNFTTIQLRIRIDYAIGNIGINDFGLVYREYRTTATDNFDET